MPMKLGQGIVTLGLHLEFSAKLRIWQVSACKMEPRSGTKISGPPTNPATQPSTELVICTGTLFLCAVSPPPPLLALFRKYVHCPHPLLVPCSENMCGVPPLPVYTFSVRCPPPPNLVLCLEHFGSVLDFEQN